MSDVLQGIAEDVRFDAHAADQLISVCEASVTQINSQGASRSSWAAAASTDFKGYFATAFDNNARTQTRDAAFLCDRLREVASAVRRLKEEAHKEQLRRNKAREWKRKHDQRNLLEKAGDWLFGEDAPPVGPPTEPIVNNVAAPPATTRQLPVSAGGMGGTSSARPDQLRSFASNSAAANETLSAYPIKLRAAYQTFVAGCHWGRLSAEGVLSGFDHYLLANNSDVVWANALAAAFEKAGAVGGVATLSDAALQAVLRSAGVKESRDDLSIDPPEAFGNPPTTGYANDPVNTATGNFLENETDLGFVGGCQNLALERCYNSLNHSVGSFGLGWSSWPESKLTLSDDQAVWVLSDGREIHFPRKGAGWDRSTVESYWLQRCEHKLVVSSNDGRYWEFSATGRLLRACPAAGAGINYEYDGEYLRTLRHDRGRSITLTWDDDVIVEASSDDGRRVEYCYDDQCRLTVVITMNGERRYSWNDQNLIRAVIDAEGVQEIENFYDDQCRVIRQRSQHGRVTNFSYLGDRVTVVADEDGQRSNTWISDAKGRLVGVIDAHGHRQSMAYDRWNNLVMATERDDVATLQEYDDRGRISRRKIPSGAIIQWRYDDHDRVTKVAVDDQNQVMVTEFSYLADCRNPCQITDPCGGVTQLQWDGGLLVSVNDPAGVKQWFAYDDHGDVVEIRNAVGTSRLERDTLGRITATITPLGNRTEYTYAESGFLASRTDPDGALWRYDYNRSGALTALIDPYGGRIVANFDQKGDEVLSIDQLGRTTSREFDDLGNLAGVKLADGSTWKFSHDALSRLTCVTLPDGQEWKQDYTTTGDLSRMIDPTGTAVTINNDPGVTAIHSNDQSLRMVWDKANHLHSITAQDGSQSVVRYDRCGRAIELVDECGQSTTIVRDAAGRITSIQRPSGAVVSYSWDECGRLSSVTNPLGATTRFEYDQQSRLVREIRPENQGGWRRYDQCGRLVAHCDTGLGTAEFEYDLMGRIVRTCDLRFGTRRFRYDAAGQLTEAISATGAVTRFGYDQLGRVITITDALGKITKRSYDAYGNMTSQADPLGRLTKLTYDQAGRLRRRCDPAGVETEWRYDQAGRLSAFLVDGELVQKIERDFVHRQAQITEFADGSETHIHQLQWDQQGRLIARARDGAVVRWTYDVDGYRSSMTASDGTTTNYRYDLAGQLIGVASTAFGELSYHYDGSGRLVAVLNDHVIQRWHYRDGKIYSYELINDGKPTLTTVLHDGDGRIVELHAEDRIQRFSYDAAGQLSGVEDHNGHHRYCYDLAGRLITELSPLGERSLSYDDAGQLILESLGSEMIRYRYDACGRRTAQESHDDSVRYDWDARGWLTSIHHNDQRTNIYIDALGELAAINGTQLSWDTAANIPHPIQIGSVPTLTTPGANVVGSAVLPVGWRQSRSQSADVWTPESINHFDPDLGLGGAGELSIGSLEWLGARIYDPATRAFLSTDPLDAVIGTGWAANPYAYCGNNPVGLLDPLGLRPVSDEELNAYARAQQGALATAWDWTTKNWEYIAGAAMVGVGGALMLTGVGGPLGLALVSAGVDTIIQRATTGRVNWGEVALSGVLGAVGGGTFAWAKAAGQGSAAALKTSMLVNAGVGSLGNTALYGVTHLDDGTPAGYLGAAFSGGITGGVSGLSGPLGGTLATMVKKPAASMMAHGITRTTNYVSGVTAYWVNATITRDSSASWEWANAAGAANALGCELGGKLPSTGTSTLKQFKNFAPRTVSGVMNLNAKNTQALWGGAGISTGVGMTEGLLDWFVHS